MKRICSIAMMVMVAYTAAAQWVPLAVNTNTGSMKPLASGSVENNWDAYGSDTSSVSTIINGGTSGATGVISRVGRDVTVVFPSEADSTFTSVWFRASLSGDFSLGNSAFNLVGWDTIEVDTAGGYDAGTDYWNPSTTGLYSLAANIQVRTSSAQTLFTAEIRYHTGGVSNIIASGSHTSPTSQADAMSIGTVMNVTATNLYFFVTARGYGGTDYVESGEAGFLFSNFSIHKVK